VELLFFNMWGPTTWKEETNGKEGYKGEMDVGRKQKYKREEKFKHFVQMQAVKHF
jgi:hypothetical protein